MARALTWFLRDSIVSTVVPSAPPREPVYMSAASPEEPDTPDRSVDLVLSFDFAPPIDEEEYSRIMRRIIPLNDDDAAAQVSAFNSSI
jgi:hypothetical protein